jgi:hypothetical protein
VTSSGSGEFHIIVGDPKEQFKMVRRVSTGKNLRGVAVADFDNNGFPDLAVADSQANMITTMINTCR